MNRYKQYCIMIYNIIINHCKMVLGVGIEGACKASKITWREKLFNLQKKFITPSIPAIVVTVKMKGRVGFHIIT